MNPRTNTTLSPGLRLAIAFVVSAASARSQAVVASVASIGPGCGTSVPQLAVTPPVVGGVFSLRVASGLGTPTLCDVVFSAPPPASPLYLGSGCVAYIDPFAFTAVGPFVTDATGTVIVTFPLPALPAIVGVAASMQALTVSPLLSHGFALSNGLGLVAGDASPYCTHGNSDYATGGIAAPVLSANFASVFASPGYLEIGSYFPSNGTASPNGIRFTANSAGIAALQSFIGGGGGSGVFSADAINPSDESTVDGGGFAKETLALALNVAFNDAMVLGSATPGFSSLVYHSPGDALDGSTVAQVLAAASVAVGGQGFPAGYDASLMKDLVGEINGAFVDCVVSAWAQSHLFDD